MGFIYNNLFRIFILSRSIAVLEFITGFLYDRKSFCSRSVTYNIVIMIVKGCIFPLCFGKISFSVFISDQFATFIYSEFIFKAFKFIKIIHSRYPGISDLFHIYCAVFFYAVCPFIICYLAVRINTPS